MNKLPASILAISVAAAAVLAQCPGRAPVQINTGGETVCHNSSISPNGQWVAYQYWNSSQRRVIARKTDGTTSTSFPPVLQNQTNLSFSVAWVTWADTSLGGAGYQEVIWCDSNSVVRRSITSNGTVGQYIYSAFSKNGASQMRLQRQAIKDHFVCSYWLTGQNPTKYELVVAQLSNSNVTVVETSTIGSFTPLDVDSTGRYVLYARPNGNGEEVVRADLVTGTKVVVGPASTPSEQLVFDSGFFGDTSDAMQFTHEPYSGNGRYTLSMHMPGATPNHAPLTDIATEELRASFVQPGQLLNPALTKRWAVYSAATLGLGTHGEIAMMPVGGGGQVVFDKLNSGIVRDVSMSRDAQKLVFSTYTTIPYHNGNVFVLDTSATGSVDNRPIHISDRAFVGGTITIEQPCSVSDSVSMYLATGTGTPYTLTGYCGQVELDSAAMFPLYQNVTATSQTVSSSYEIPVDNALIGTALYFQGLRSPGPGTADISRVVRLRIFAASTY